MAKTKRLRKDKMNWLFNQSDARRVISSIGARNLTYINAVYVTSTEEEHIEQYSKMCQYNSQQADQETILWMKRMIEFSKTDTDSRYLYFRFVRIN